MYIYNHSERLFFFFNVNKLLNPALNKVTFQYTIKSCNLIALKIYSTKSHALKACLHEKNEDAHTI